MDLLLMLLFVNDNSKLTLFYNAIMNTHLSCDFSVSNVLWECQDLFKNMVLKCDQIQILANGPFTHNDMTWFENQAWIPKFRLKDFLKGEECRPKFNTCLKFFKTMVRNKERGFIDQ